MAQPIKFYTDEHVPKAVIKGLRHRGADVLTTGDAGLLGATDEEHLARAKAEGRTLFTQDTDFLRLHATGIDHAGIAYAPQGTSIHAMIRGLLFIHQTLDGPEMYNRLEYL